MVAPGSLPRFITIGPVEHREFAPDGRLVIPSVVSTAGRAPELAKAEALALALDVFYKRDLSVGGSYTFKLEELPDPWGSPGLIYRAYGTLVPIPLDWDWFAAHAMFEVGAEGLQRQPADSPWPSVVGHLAGWSEQGIVVPSLFDLIRTTADATDEKWARAGFAAGQPWDGTMPDLGRKESAAFDGLWGFTRERRRWEKKNAGGAS